jgi:hypothetical protein
MSRSQRESVPWWAPGDGSPESETCPYCLGVYVYELEVRCVDCDRPMCPVCAVVEQRTAVHLCVECGCDEAAG